MLANSLLVSHRILLKIPLGFDSFPTLVAFVAALLLVIQITWAIQDEGQGKHVGQLPRSHLALIGRSLLANETLWGLANSLLRISALLSIKAMFCPLPDGRERMGNGLIVATALHGIAVVLEVFLICRPIAAAWDNNFAGMCGDQIVSYVVLEILGLLIDLVILVLPVWSLAKLEYSLRRKAGLSFVFSGGFVVIIINGLRVQALRMTTSTDFTLSRGYLDLLSVLGCLLSIICCCIPSVVSVFNKLRYAHIRVHI
ncbi:hypothetical protein N7G274_001363 [Stereocaulon virgatum]|uniref:Rhodopsin domain-containing protein n=1 Tax=Stereocaulon virgatum TaxID=373712 RepID=A0ABR4ARB2_9LECA